MSGHWRSTEEESLGRSLSDDDTEEDLTWTALMQTQSKKTRAASVTTGVAGSLHT